MTKEDAINQVLQELEEEAKKSFLSRVRDRVSRIQELKDKIRWYEEEIEKEKNFLSKLEYKPAVAACAAFL